MRLPKRRSPIVPAIIALVLLGGAIAGALWFVGFRARSEAEAGHGRLTRLYANKESPPTCDQLGTAFLELVDSSVGPEILAQLDAELGAVAYDSSANAVYFIHVRDGSRPCLGRAYKDDRLGRGHNHSGFPDIFQFQKIDVAGKGVSLQFATVKEESQRAAIERYGLEPGVTYVSSFEGPTDAFDLTGLARRARRK